MVNRDNDHDAWDEIIEHLWNNWKKMEKNGTNEQEKDSGRRDTVQDNK